MNSFPEENKISRCDNECLQALQLILDGEASKEDEDQFMRHIDDCVHCYSKYQLDKTVKEILQNKIEKKKVPAAIVQEIKNRILIFNKSA